MTDSNTHEEQSYLDAIVSFLTAQEVTHYETEISDGENFVMGYGNTPEESQENASEQWDEYGGSNDDEGDCCYLVSACLDAKELPRSSPEMKAMKHLTKSFILQSFQGRRDYISYKRKAPGIVQAIKDRKEAQDIWDGIHKKLETIASSVHSNNLREGHRLYKELVLDLESRYI
ncbi:hypothetical protein CMI42_00090 [Candidatus Pacearchaeota archaeon]|nr:hypothetical protein [Candidatus Pacearchaeota archaeon]|tara:strand:+ start:831 stop:1352 length:522 start_codon:yes stop_codon:yes gene_type:complete